MEVVERERPMGDGKKQANRPLEELVGVPKVANQM